MVHLRVTAPFMFFFCIAFCSLSFKNVSLLGGGSSPVKTEPLQIVLLCVDVSDARQCNDNH